LNTVTRRGTVRELHELDPFAGPVAPELWWLQPSDAALVLGSRQHDDLVDLGECARLGLAVVRRRSGGGVVLVVPHQFIWVDIVASHGTAPDDIRGSMVWAGEMWRQALTPWAGERALTVHDGSMVTTPWSQLVCFAGLGPGEVLLDGRKLVGLSQRRTRHGIRIQGSLYTAQPEIDISTLLRGPLPAAPLPDVATLAVDPADLVANLAAELR
jgi:lipoate-protein ligase A